MRLRWRGRLSQQVCLTGQDTDYPVPLDIYHVTDVDLPVADPGSDEDYPNAKAGDMVVLNGLGSTPGSYDFPTGSYCQWYLTSKPAASKALLNLEAGPTTEFHPDVAGTYEIEMLVYSSYDVNVLYSTPGVLQLTVDP